MLDHLKEAKVYTKQAENTSVAQAPANAQIAIAHIGIALVELLAERLPPPAETASECQTRLRQEERATIDTDCVHGGAETGARHVGVDDATI